MDQPRPGRPPKPLDPEASQAARFGAAVRVLRQAQGLTQKALADLIGFTFQHVSEVELAKASVSKPFVVACDRVLEAHGSLLELFPLVAYERTMQRHDRADTRRLLPGETETKVIVPGLVVARYAGPEYSSEEELDVEPFDRRSLIGVGVGAALGLHVAPAAARDIDPGLVDHWMQLLGLLDRHAAIFGAHEGLAIVQHELGRIGRYRQVASGSLRTDLQRVESRWAGVAAWLSNDTGDADRRDAWTAHAARLAQEANDRDMTAYLLMRQSQWAAEELDPERAISFAAAGLRVSGASRRTHALCTSKAAYGHALAGDTTACERSLAETARLLSQPSTASESAGQWGLSDLLVTGPYIRAAGARCWLSLRPQKAVAMFEDALGRWPRERARDRGLHQTRLAVACAAANEPDRAVAEGVKALGIVRTTKSDVTVRELKRLDQRLSRFDVPGVGEFREGLRAI